MMTTRRRNLALCVGVVLSLTLPSLAVAAPSGAVIQLHFQDTGERRVVMAASDNGLVFIGEDFGNFRAFRSDALSQDGDGRPFLWVMDVDDDGALEYVYGGDPSFVLDAGADPLFGANQGCDDFYVGNILEDEQAEIFCRNRSTIKVWNWDGQFLWEYSLSGARITQCLADDVDSDERLEFACEAGGAWTLIDLGNSEPVQDVDDNPATRALSDPFGPWAAEAAAALNGELTFDINGDGDAAETLSWSGSALTINSATGPMGAVDLPESDLYSVAVGDLNGDGTPEVFVGGVGAVYVISPSGELLATVEANPNDLSRSGRVEVQSASANGLEDSSSETTRAAVADGLSRVERCYRDEMGSNQFVRVGGMFYELTIDGRGRVSSSNRIHSGVANSDLESCVENALEDMRFSSATEGGGSVSVRLNFDFVDQ